MSLNTQYMGLSLKHPLISGASPAVQQLDYVRRLEDAGVAAIVMPSLFAEQIGGTQMASIYRMEMYADGYEDSASQFPEASDYLFGPQEYLEHVRTLKQTVDVPVIGSLNGTAPGNWTEYAKLIEVAGADALELNLHLLSTDPEARAETIEQQLLEVTRDVVCSVRIPVAVKLLPFFTSLSNFATRLEVQRISGIVLFNRGHDPDVDIEAEQLGAGPLTSRPGELPLRLHWLSILSRYLSCSLAVSGGVHTAAGVIKSLMAGANAVQLVSCLMRRGPEHVGTLLRGLTSWMHANGYASLRDFQGCAKAPIGPDVGSFDRGRYVRTLQGKFL